VDTELEVRVSMKVDMTLAEALELESALRQSGYAGAPAALQRALSIQIGAAQAAMVARRSA
jgi:hypothetical protein